jgi:hypothetical protein
MERRKCTREFKLEAVRLIKGRGLFERAASGNARIGAFSFACPGAAMLN